MGAGVQTQSLKATTRSHYDYIIVGAGLTGLALGRRLQESNKNLHIAVLEKSRGCGGRMATRRTTIARFDHGAQFIKQSNVSSDLIRLWLSQNVVREFPSNVFKAVCGVTGMTQPAKFLAQTLEVQFEVKAENIRRMESKWKISDEAGLSRLCNNVILTCPLPQSLELLQKSEIHYNSQLNQITYSKAIVFLAEFETELSSDLVYLEGVDHEIFSICSQAKKGLCETPCYSIVMDELWREKNFSCSDQELNGVASDLLQQKFPSHHLKNLNLKKWRYCQPKATWSEPYYSPYTGIYLAGDAFGGPSLNGALRSAEALFAELSGCERAEKSS